MKKISVIILASVLSFSISSCSNDDDIAVEETLTGGKWKLVRLEFNGEDITSSDLDECDLMDTYEFNNDNTFIYTSHEKENGTGSCTNATISGFWIQDTSVPNSLRFIAAFEGDDINNEAGPLNFRIEDKVLREIVLEPAAEGGFETYFFFYEKQ